MLTDLGLGRAGKEEQTAVGQSELFGVAKDVLRNVLQLAALDPFLDQHHLIKLLEEPRVDPRQTVNLLDRVAVLKRVGYVRKTLRVGPGQLSLQLVVGDSLKTKRLYGLK